jgi:hypothetical protein
MRTTKQFLSLLNKEAKKATGTQDEKNYMAWKKIYNTLCKGEEDNFNSAWKIFKCGSVSKADIHSKKVAEAIDRQVNSKSFKAELNAMWNSKGFLSNVALD